MPHNIPLQPQMMMGHAYWKPSYAPNERRDEAGQEKKMPISVASVHSGQQHNFQYVLHSATSGSTHIFFPRDGK